MARRSYARLRRQVERDSGRRFGYCLVPQEFVPVPLELEHLQPRALGGPTVRTNLWLSCPTCNRYKRNLISGTDPETGRTVRLFNPRVHIWADHFVWSKDGLRIIGCTAVGRATVATLQLNHELWLPCRRLWVSHGLWPPELRAQSR